MAWKRRSLVDRVADSWRRAGAGGVLAAASGGGDSTALVRLLVAAREVLGAEPAPRIAVAHLDHARRASSGGDAGFVAGLAAELGLTLRTARLAPEAARDLEGEGGIQARAREERSARFEGWAGELGLSLVALGHTRDDQAETVLLQLLRGAGARGLAGMGERGPGRLWRPLLEVGRGELRAWLGERGAAWREDESNASPRFLRNRVRHQVLPLLEELRPGAAKTLARAARLLAEDERELAAAAERALATVPGGEGGLVLPFGLLDGLGGAVRARVYAGAVARLGGTGLDEVGVGRLEGLLARRRVGARAAVGGVAVRARRDGLEFRGPG